MRSLFLTALVLFTTNSCTYLKGPKRLIADELEIVESEYIAELNRQQNQQLSAKANLTWNQAVTTLLNRNPDVLRANFAIEDSTENMKSVWRNLIPTLRLSLSDSATIENISTLFEDTNLRVSSFIFLSNLLDLPKTVYSNKIRLISAELASEQIMRNQVIALYRLFKEQQLLDLQQQAINYEKELLSAEYEDQNSFAYLKAFETHKGKSKELSTKRKELVRKVNDLYMTSYTDINLKYSTLPNRIYTSNQLDLHNAKRWGRLQLNLLAIESIADKARVKDLYARYLPDFFLNVSAPALFQSNSNSDFRFEDIRLSPSFSWSLDTRNSIGNAIDRHNREANIRQWSKEKRRSDEISRLLEGKAAIANLERELSDHAVETKEYQELVKSGDLYQVDIRKVISDFIVLKEAEISMRAKIIDISTSFWLLDEHRWGSVSKEWKRIRLRQEAERRKKRGKIPFFRKKPSN